MKLNRTHKWDELAQNIAKDMLAKFPEQTEVTKGIFKEKGIYLVLTGLPLRGWNGEAR